jgi:hypothetical protein
MQDTADQLVRYVHGQEDQLGFLPWREHERYRAQYGVGRA